MMPDAVPTRPEPPSHVPRAGRHVFVYGTLRRGQANDITRLAPKPVYIGAGSIAGTMYHFGAYPGVLLGTRTKGGDVANGPRVVGEVYAIEAELERLLDEIEEVYPQRRDEYARREVELSVGGRAYRCLVYEVNPLYAAAAPVIGSGDWLQRDESAAAS